MICVEVVLLLLHKQNHHFNHNEPYYTPIGV